MIILDTCILRECGLRSSSTDLLRTIRAVGVQGVAVPWMVMEEIAAQQALKYTQKYEAAARAIDSLKQATPWGSVGALLPCDTDRVREHWRTAWRSVVDVIPTSESALREAAFREANGLAPCKVHEGGRSVKTGFRDTAIWMSAMEYAREHPDETVYFVSSNTRDFGDGDWESYREPMDQDVQDLEGRFVHLTSLDDVVGRFARQTETDESLALQVLKSTAACKAASAAAPMTATVARPFQCTVASGAFGEETRVRAVIGWAEEPLATLDSVQDVEAYQIGEHEWYAATARWFLCGTALTRGATHLVSAGCAWQARVLFTASSGADDPRLTVLHASLPTLISTSDFDSLPMRVRAPQSIPALMEDKPSHLLRRLRNSLAHHDEQATLCLTCGTPLKVGYAGPCPVCEEIPD